MKKTLLCWLAALGAAAVIPACGGAAGDKSLSGLDRERFRSEVNGRPTDLYTLTNAAGMEVCITNFGGRIVSVMVPDRTGTLRDVVLGFDNIADYVRIPSDFGASIGRYANRIGHGRFVLDGDTVRLPVNNYGHCLHGGPDVSRLRGTPARPAVARPDIAFARRRCGIPRRRDCEGSLPPDGGQRHRYRL